VTKAGRKAHSCQEHLHARPLSYSAARYGSRERIHCPRFASALLTHRVALAEHGAALRLALVLRQQQGAVAAAAAAAVAAKL
jgi:hypothetical protein